MSEDPIGFSSGDSNFYRYVGNNPLSYQDPYGEAGYEYVLIPATFAICSYLLVKYVLVPKVDKEITSELCTSGGGQWQNGTCVCGSDKDNKNNNSCKKDDQKK